MHDYARFYIGFLRRVTNTRKYSSFKFIVIICLATVGVIKVIELGTVMSDEKNTENSLPSIPDDSRLIEIVRKEYLKPPSNIKYNLSFPFRKDQSEGQAQEIMKLLKNKTKGFFIESGGYDGEFLSNSLVFERYLNWDGVIIEPDPIFYKKLLSKNRRCWSVNACLSPGLKSQKLLFQRNGYASAIANYSFQEEKSEFVYTQCLPLYSILLALNVTKVDYLSLDVEAVELEVLKSIPWDKVNITTLSVEVQYLGKKKMNLVTYMQNLGYDILKEINGNKTYNDKDYIFYHPKLLDS